MIGPALPIDGKTMDGYMIDVTLDETTLRVRGKNKAARVALAGESHGDGDVVLTRDQIADVTFKDASMLVNGRVTVRAVDGRVFKLHFRKKQAADFRGLAEGLGCNAA